MLLTVERMLPLASLALVGCATAPPPVLSAADWRVEPPAAACEARSERKQGVMLRRYDAEGRLLFATTMPFTDMHGAEWFTWRGNKLVAVDSYLEGAGGRLFCGRGDSGAEGRWIERSDLRWQGEQLVEITQSLRAYQRDDSCDNVWRLHDHREHSSSYEYRGPWLKAQGSYIRYDFEGDRPVRRHRKMGLIFGGELVDRWIWKGDRVTTYLWNDYTERFEYDAQGRLIAEWVDDPRDQSRTNRFWAYDGRGAVQRATVQVVPGGRQPPYDRSCEFQYDEGGREILASCGPSSRTETKYFGSCAKVIQAEPAPNVFEIMNARPCLNTQGRLGQRCF